MTEKQEATQALIDLTNGRPEAQDKLRVIIDGQVRMMLDQLREVPPSSGPPSFSQLVHEVLEALVDTELVNDLDQIRFRALTSEVAEEAVAGLLREAKAARKAVTLPTRGRTPSSLSPVQTEQLLSLERALQDLAELDPRLRRLAIWHYYGGLSERELADYLEVSETSIRRDLIKARGLIYRGFRRPS